MAHAPILIVDDNPQHLKLARVLLSNEGYEVRSAGDADQALEVLQTFRPRLILMGLQLPGMDGFARKLKSDPHLTSVVIIALTHATKGDDERARAVGCDGSIPKPIDLEDLPRTVAAYLTASDRE